MNDRKIFQHITELVEEEHRLENNVAEAGSNAARVREIADQLDLCWDLLRQRRAKREFGASPNDAELRDVDVVERYSG